MNIRTQPAETVVVELEAWEARRLRAALSRIGNCKSVVGKSEFSLPEKIVMRKLKDAL
jgi:hypothetical protein